MARLGRDNEDTHENMQNRRVLRKYEQGKSRRHVGQQRLRHKGDDPLSAPGE